MKVGRNEMCPCGSGLKYKRCCAKRSAASRTAVVSNAKRQGIQSLTKSVTVFQEYARKKSPFLGMVGVFLLFSDEQGDAWLFEMTQADCVQIAAKGESLVVDIEENEETISVDWSHSFSFKEKQLVLKNYATGADTVLENAPSQRIAAAIRKTLKLIPQESMQQLHHASQNM